MTLLTSGMRTWGGTEGHRMEDLASASKGWWAGSVGLIMWRSVSECRDGLGGWLCDVDENMTDNQSSYSSILQFYIWSLDVCQMINIVGPTFMYTYMCNPWKIHWPAAFRPCPSLQAPSSGFRFAHWFACGFWYVYFLTSDNTSKELQALLVVSLSQRQMSFLLLPREVLAKLHSI